MASFLAYGRLGGESIIDVFKTMALQELARVMLGLMGLSSAG